MRWTWDTQLLKSGSISQTIFYLICANALVSFVLGIFFDGGAFPWGEIRGDQFLIVNNQGTKEVSGSWFWFTYWQGLSAWISIGLFFVIGSVYDLAHLSRKGTSNGRSGPLTMLVLSSTWLIGVVSIARGIAY